MLGIVLPVVKEPLRHPLFLFDRICAFFRQFQCVSAGFDARGVAALSLILHHFIDLLG
jgi:hypothetical protein